MNSALQKIKQLAGMIPGVNPLIEEVQDDLDDLEQEVEDTKNELEETDDPPELQELDLGFGIIYYQADNLAVQNWIDDIQIAIKGHALHLNSQATLQP